MKKKNIQSVETLVKYISMSELPRKLIIVIIITTQFNGVLRWQILFLEVNNIHSKPL